MHEISIPRKQLLSHKLFNLSPNMTRTLRENLTIPFLLVDLILVNIAFFSMNFVKRNTLELDIKYFKLLLLFYLVWAGITYFTKKFKLSSYPDFKHAFLLIIKSTFINAINALACFFFASIISSEESGRHFIALLNASIVNFFRVLNSVTDSACRAAKL